MPLISPLASRRSKIVKIASLITVHFALITILTGCSAVGFSKPAALQITSKPEAAVFLDGKHIGKTPFFSDQLKAGTHKLKITISEASYVDEINLNPGTLMVVNRDLAPNFLAQSGETLSLVPNQKGLFITSMPSGAAATVDGKLIGITPALVTDIPDGDHKVQITKDGYLSREFTIKTTSRYQLLAEVTLASVEAKNIAEGVSPTPAPVLQKVQISDTPQGFLRVRQDASLTSPEIGRVKDGDQLEVISEVSDWIQVKFPAQPTDGQVKQGWISSQYTKKVTI